LKRNLNLLLNSNSKVNKTHACLSKKCTLSASTFYLPHNQILKFRQNPLTSEVVGRKKYMGTDKGFQLLLGGGGVLEDI
jgi:hypothetical protein